MTQITRRTFLGAATCTASLGPGQTFVSSHAGNIQEPSADGIIQGAIWLDDEDAEPDTFALFRTSFELDTAAVVEFRCVGASTYTLWLDGNWLLEGPIRFEPTHPEYTPLQMHLKAGRHTLAARVRHEGVETRILKSLPPFLWCEAAIGDRVLDLSWRAHALEGQRKAVRRVNPQLGWIEWRDTRQEPERWRGVDFDDSAWPQAEIVKRDLPAPKPAVLGEVKRLNHSIRPSSKGSLAEVFGYELDNPEMRFFLRDLECRDLPAQGIWRRYDLGRVRLGRPSFKLDLPPGAVVEIAYAEALSRGRVSPVIPLSAGSSCHLDHFIARGGVQEISPHDPRSGRYMEIHILAKGDVKVLDARFDERTYYGRPIGTFECNDKNLERIWTAGVETYRACTEDAITDNPTRERGQWLGDATIALEVATSAFSDPRPVRRALTMAAQCARDDGLVAGLCPGNIVYLSTFAAQWAAACVRYHQLTGDAKLLNELYPAALRNMSAFEPHRTEAGIKDQVGWAFVDWGYVRPPGETNLALTLHYLSAVRAMKYWSSFGGRLKERERFGAIDEQLSGAISNRAANESFEELGYHATVLMMHHKLLPHAQVAKAVDFIKRRLSQGFPNTKSASRLSDPSTANEKVITPYFGHFALGVLLENGDAEFVQDQYRQCWGWALENGRTTLLEVFDTRWSHCHQWSAAPTWQLSRYVLGMHPRFDIAAGRFELKLSPGALREASGRVPLPNLKEPVNVKWRRSDDVLHYQVESPADIQIHIPGRAGSNEIIDVDAGREMEIELALNNAFWR